MQFFDLNEQNNLLKEEIRMALEKVIQSGRFILGPEVENFEKEAAKLCGTQYSVGVNSGTDALFLSLLALGVGRGDEVITTPFTFIATAEVIANLGAKPVFADIDPETFNISPKEIEKKLSKATKAIVPVHLFGHPADMVEIMEIARLNNLKVVEDAAQAIGAECQGRTVGSFGDLGCFSFFPTKNLGAFGDAGLITANSQNLTEKVRMLRAHGSSPQDKYLNLILGVNSRLDALQAAILNIKLKYLPDWNKKRQEKAMFYNTELKNLSQMKVPVVAQGRTHIFHQYTIKAQKRDALKEFLQKEGIPTMVYYVLPLHLQPAFEYLGYKKGDFPAAEKATEDVLSLPIYPELKRSEQDDIVKKIKEFYEQHR